MSQAPFMTVPCVPNQKRYQLRPVEKKTLQHQTSIHTMRGGKHHEEIRTSTNMSICDLGYNCVMIAASNVCCICRVISIDFLSPRGLFFLSPSNIKIDIQTLTWPVNEGNEGHWQSAEWLIFYSIGNTCVPDLKRHSFIT